MHTDYAKADHSFEPSMKNFSATGVTGSPSEATIFWQSRKSLLRFIILKYDFCCPIEILALFLKSWHLTVWHFNRYLSNLKGKSLPCTIKRCKRKFPDTAENQEWPPKRQNMKEVKSYHSLIETAPAQPLHHTEMGTFLNWNWLSQADPKSEFLWESPHAQPPLCFEEL